MRLKRQNSVICLGDTKQAALYFDRILPLSFVYQEIARTLLEQISHGRKAEDFSELSIEEHKRIAEDYFETSQSPNCFHIFENLIGSEISGTMLGFLKGVLVLSIILCEIVFCQFFEKRQIIGDIPYGF
jgi:hypothetical protein